MRGLVLDTGVAFVADAALRSRRSTTSTRGSLCLTRPRPSGAERCRRAFRGAGIRRRSYANDDSESAAVSSQASAVRDDDVLPDNLDDCLAKSAVASARALEQGNARVIVEVFVPELFDPLSGAMMSNEGDQQRYWGMTRAFCDGLVAATGLRLRAIYPDAGVAAMLSSQWSDAQFSLSSLNDRQPVQSDDELVVVACPDPQGVAEVRKIADALMREPSEESGASVAGLGRPLVLFNPRLASGDVGIGLSVRRLRSEFLASFCMAYALRPFEGGAVFKQHPDKWKVFYADPAQQGRFTLIAERAERPGGEELENIILDFLDEGIAGSQNGARGGQDGGSVGDSEPPGWASTLGEVGKVAASLQRFMRDITR